VREGKAAIADAAQVAWLKFHNLRSLKVAIPGPLRAPTRADEHLIVSLTLALSTNPAPSI